MYNISFYSNFILWFYKVLKQIESIFIMDSLTINMIFGYQYTKVQNCAYVPSVWNPSNMFSSRHSHCVGIWMSPRLFHQVKNVFQSCFSLGQNKKKCVIWSVSWQYKQIALSTNFILNKLCWQVIKRWIDLY